MQKKILVFFLILPSIIFGQKFQTRFEQSNGTQTPTYTETIDWWKQLDASSPYIQMKEMGPTDAGYPLHLVLISRDKDFDIASIKKKKKTIILVNNGIHPGEPDGIDASMLLAKEIIENYNQEEKVKKAVGRIAVKRNLFELPSNIVLAIIPVYNIGGALNRSANYRVDQNGPEEFGFRGNSQNLDLNRDFIKCDSKEALTFAKIFHYLDPDVFVDNHVSNGADYQHVMTLLTSQHNKLGGKLGEYLSQTFEPALYTSMKNMGWDLVPYVSGFSESPEKGWSGYWDSPRYSSGYASLWSTFAFVPETHMLKSYKQRVEATRDLMKCFIGFASNNANEIIQLRDNARKQQMIQNEFAIAWKLDRTRSTQINYKGYTSGRKPSEISGLPRLYYDRSKPFEIKIPFYNFYNDTLSVQKPKAYVIPQGWWKVIERLQANKVQMRRLTRDTTIDVEWYRIESYQSGTRPYEGHHLNTAVQVSAKTGKISFRKGDWFIPLNQKANRFLVETLEPHAEDSYFAWNFFDPILGQKEGFSDYVFEETAVAFLKENPDVLQKLNDHKASDSAFAKNGRAQLNFIYQNSPYYEPAHLRYPVYRVN